MRKAIPHLLLGLLSIGSAVALGLPLALHYGNLKAVTLPVQGCALSVNGSGVVAEKPTVATFSTNVPSSAVGHLGAYQFPGSKRVVLGPVGSCTERAYSNQPIGTSTMNLFEMSIVDKTGHLAVLNTFAAPTTRVANVYLCGYFAAAAAHDCASDFGLFANSSPTTGLTITGRSGATLKVKIKQAEGQVTIVAAPKDWNSASLNGRGLLFTVVNLPSSATAADHGVAQAAMASSETAAHLSWRP
jgi:hypothetical protein